MEYILLLLSLFAVLKSLFMTSLLPNRWYRLAFSLLLGVFVLLSIPTRWKSINWNCNVYCPRNRL